MEPDEEQNYRLCLGLRFFELCWEEVLVPLLLLLLNTDTSAGLATDRKSVV